MLRTRQRANIEGATALFPDTEVQDHINQSIAKWYDEVRGSTWGGQYYRSFYTFNTTPSQSATPFPFPLPQDFLSMISVDIALAQNTVISARPFQEEQRNYYRGVYPIMGWFYATNIFYQIWGQNIYFTPGPQSVTPVTLNYCPVAPRLFRPLDTLDSINGWEEFIVLDSAIKCLIKDGQTDMIQVLQGRLEEEKERIRANAPRRDMSQAENVHQVDTSFDTFW